MIVAAEAGSIHISSASENVMMDENVATREGETMEWSADVGAGSQANAAAEMQRWA